MLPAWTPVSCALPRHGRIAVGIDNQGDYCLIVNVAGQLHDYHTGRRASHITHWTPVPPPPEAA